MLNNLFDLLIKVRGDKFVAIADIRKAYLMVRLKKDSDKDKFRVLWLNKDGKLVCYRYTRVVFGHIASQFILNRVIGHHLQKYSDDLCKLVLTDNIYVDNLFLVHENEQVLLELCREARSRMLAGGFELRSWASNSNILTRAFKEDNIASESADLEKLLGYNYSTKLDDLTVNVKNLSAETGSVTKRKVLAGISRVFDPLGLVVPVTVKGKLIMQSIWNLKVGWDEPLPSGIVSQYNGLLGELSELCNFSFSRPVYKDSFSLVIFTDASKSIYGFSCYCRYVANDEVCTNLLFSKAKNSPCKNKTLPTLELLAVYLALKCLFSLFCTLRPQNILSIVVGVDAQIVLSWILSKNVKTKNIFAKNKVNDITAFRDRFKKFNNLEIIFKYVPTSLIVVDFLTKPMSANVFGENLD